MKKVLLFLLLAFFCFSKPYSQSEKKEVLEQFKELQIAVRAKDKNKLLSYINFPVSMYGTGEKINKKDFTNYYEEHFSYFDMLKINNTEITRYFLLSYRILIYIDNVHFFKIQS